MHEIEQIIEGYRAQIGEILGVTEEFSIRQSEIDVFGAVTQNIDPMHNDPEWGKDGPWGSTIVHGLFLLSYAAKFWKESGVPIYTTEKIFRCFKIFFLPKCQKDISFSCYQEVRSMVHTNILSALWQ